MARAGAGGWSGMRLLGRVRSVGCSAKGGDGRAPVAVERRARAAPFMLHGRIDLLHLTRLLL